MFCNHDLFGLYLPLKLWTVSTYFQLYSSSMDCAGSSKSWRPQLPIFTHPVTPVHPVVTPTRPGGDRKPQPAIPKYPIWVFASKARLCMSLHNLLCYHTLKNLVYIHAGIHYQNLPTNCMKC